MGSPDRYIIKKIYAIRAGLFGLIFGIIGGAVLGFIQLLVALSLFKVIIDAIASSLPPQINLGITNYAPTFSLTVYLIIVGVYAFFGFFVCFFGALVYNALSLVGVRIHIDLTKYLIAPKTQQ